MILKSMSKKTNAHIISYSAGIYANIIDKNLTASDTKKIDVYIMAITYIVVVIKKRDYQSQQIKQRLTNGYIDEIK